MDKDLDIDAISDEDIFEEARERLQISYAADVENRNLAKDDLLFREGENHWDNNVVTGNYDQSPELVINFTDTLVGRVVNSIAELETRGKCHPIADGANVEIADVINGIGRHIEYRSSAQVAYDVATDSAVSMGWGWARLLGEWAAPNSFDKEIRIAPIMDAFTVYPDPGAIMPTAQDMRWCLISLMQKRSEFKRLNPKVELVDWNDVGQQKGLEWVTKEEIRIAQYFRIHDKTEMLYQVLLADGTKIGVWKSDLPTNRQLNKIGGKIIAEREGTRSEVQLFHLSGTQVTQREILPGSFIPVVRFEGNARSIDGKIYRRGMVRTLQDPQRMVDYGEVAKIKRLGLTPQAPWVAAEGQLDGHPEWTDSNISSYPVLTYKPVTVNTGQGEVPLPPPQRQPPAQVEAGFSEFVQGMRSNLLAIAGMPNEPGQDARGETVSGRALERRDKLSDQSHSQYYRNKKLSVAHMWRILLDWIPAYYSEERMQRIIGGDNKPQIIGINQSVTGADGVSQIKNDLTVGRYDVVMEAGPSHETMREESSDMLVDIVTSPGPMGEIVAKTAPDLVFRSMNGLYTEEIADRLAAQTPDGLKRIMESLPKEARSVVQSLTTEVTNLKNQLQQAQQEAKFGLAKAHLAATVKAHDVEETNKTRRADTESRERTALQVEAMKVHGELSRAEIDAGAQLLNTHAEAMHETLARRETLEAAERAENSNGAM